MTWHRCLLTLSLLAVLLDGRHAEAQEKIRVAEMSPRTEAAIENALNYLAKVQNADGSWGRQNQIAVTSLSLMGFMVKGHFPDREPYGKNMAQGLEFLLKQARLNQGYLGINMYEHGLATLALSEVWGESKRSDEVREALRNAVSVIVKNQANGGGWGYQPNRANPYQDVSITVMQLVAMASAKEAGILVPDETMTRAIAYVRSCQDGNGHFGYKYRGDNFVGGTSAPFARTAAGTISLLMAGDRKSEEVTRGIKALHNMGQGVFNPQYPWFYYGHYYAVQAMYQSSEKDYLAWYPRLRDSLLYTQQPDGSWRGGIPAGVRTLVPTDNDRDSYCTPMAILILGVPYRYLPIYQR